MSSAEEDRLVGDWWCWCWCWWRWRRRRRRRRGPIACGQKSCSPSQLLQHCAGSNNCGRAQTFQQTADFSPPKMLLTMMRRRIIMKPSFQLSCWPQETSGCQNLVTKQHDQNEMILFGHNSRKALQHNSSGLCSAQFFISVYFYRLAYKILQQMIYIYNFSDKSCF